MQTVPPHGIDLSVEERVCKCVCKCLLWWAWLDTTGTKSLCVCVCVYSQTSKPVKVVLGETSSVLAPRPLGDPVALVGTGFWRSLCRNRAEEPLTSPEEQRMLV